MPKLLDKINTPGDLKKLKRKDLPYLAVEIREVIIGTISKTGGHLASNLGVVELTIALHYTFNTPLDKIIWDVSHQAYTHKLLTGRKDKFHTIRQYGGISGFTRRKESIYDVFNAGHGGTSISAALAMAKARDYKNTANKVVAVIGDGSMTAGLALEGLNNAGHLNTDIIVILNDNEMSISPNVGALSSYLNRIISGQIYNKTKHEVESLLGTIPGIGKQMAQFAGRIEEAVKGIFTPGRIFEDLGFNYIGPIRGHNFQDLLKTFEGVRRLNGPILVHVVTKKGKGYGPAEREADSFHGVSPFDIRTGKGKKKGDIPSYTSIFGSTLVKLAKNNNKILAITAAMTDGTGLDKFAEKYPDRFYDVGIAEQHAVTFAGGIAAEGFKPVVAIYSTFLQRSYDQIFHDVCLMNLPVVFALDRAGIVGEDGPTHQGTFDLSYLRSLPNIILMSPKDENELQHMLKTAIDYNGPAAVRYPRGSGIGIEIDSKIISLKIGRGEILRDGEDIAIFAIGNTVRPSMEAANLLMDKNISAAVINARFVKPLDAKLIKKYAERTGIIITVEENVLQGGFGSAILELVERENIIVKVKRIGLPDKFIEHGHSAVLRRKYGIDAQGIVSQIEEYLKKAGEVQLTISNEQLTIIN